MNSIIFIDQGVIKLNSRLGSNKPPIRIRRGDENIEASSVDILGPCRIVYHPHLPHKYGPRVWIETDAEVKHT